MTKPRECLAALLTGILVSTIASAQPQTSEPVFDPPESCEVEPSRVNTACINRENDRCEAQFCDLTHGSSTEGGAWRCNWSALAACVNEIPDKCPSIPAVIEQTACSRCAPKPTHEAVCKYVFWPTGAEKIVACEAGSEMDELEQSGRWECGPCQPVRPPGEYKDCSCGDDEWLEWCPETISTETHKPHPCDLAPQFCNSTDSPNGS